MNMTQIDLEGNEIPDVSVEEEIVEYEIFETDKWRLKARKLAVQELYEEEDAIMMFVQQKIRVKDKDTKLVKGEFDEGVEKIVNAIIKSNGF